MCLRTKHWSLFLVLVMHVLAPAQQAPAQQASEPQIHEQQTPEQLIRRMTDFLGNQPQFTFKITFKMEWVGPGMETHFETVSSFDVDRPQRFAIRLNSGSSGATLVCDGEKLYCNIPELQRYTISEASGNIQETLAASSLVMPMSGPMQGFTSIGGDACYDTMMTGVTGSKAVGRDRKRSARL